VGSGVEELAFSVKRLRMFVDRCIDALNSSYANERIEKFVLSYLLLVIVKRLKIILNLSRDLPCIRECIHDYENAAKIAERIEVARYGDYTLQDVRESLEALCRCLTKTLNCFTL